MHLVSRTSILARRRVAPKEHLQQLKVFALGHARTCGSRHQAQSFRTAGFPLQGRQKPEPPSSPPRRWPKSFLRTDVLGQENSTERLPWRRVWLGGGSWMLFLVLAKQRGGVLPGCVGLATKHPREFNNLFLPSELAYF